jgi:hypothetical protein
MISAVLAAIRRTRTHTHSSKPRQENALRRRATRRLLFAGAHGINLTDLTDELSAAWQPKSPEYDLAFRIFERMMLKG